MGLVAKNQGGTFTPAPAGTHVARCVKIIDIGMQHGEYQGKATARHQVVLYWELPEEMMETEDGERPFIASEFYTNSLNEKAKLRHHLEAWRGKPFTAAELDGFDLHNILGAPCMLTVIHEPKADGSVRAKVSGVTALPKSLKDKMPPQVNKSVAFDCDDPDLEVFKSLGDGMQAIIKKSDNWKAWEARGGRPPMGNPGEYDIPEDDSIPF